MKRRPGMISSEVRGPSSRFRVDQMQTRDGGVEWFLLDAERPDELGLASVVAQGTEAEVEARYSVLRKAAEEEWLLDREIREDEAASKDPRFAHMFLSEEGS